MKERPIIFNDAMVRAILEGRKTQTRRIVKPQTITVALLSSGFKNAATGKMVRCPFGQPADRLWVRECFQCHNDGAAQCLMSRPSEPIYYRADASEFDLSTISRWRPSIHMPRWASRITLEVAGVRVERLQDISEEDAKAEGCGRELAEVDSTRLGATATHGNAFARLWQSIYGAESWRSNPWVWAVEFRRLECQA